MRSILCLGEDTWAKITPRIVARLVFETDISLNQMNCQLLLIAIPSEYRMQRIHTRKVRKVRERLASIVYRRRDLCWYAFNLRETLPGTYPSRDQSHTTLNEDVNISCRRAHHDPTTSTVRLVVVVYDRLCSSPRLKGEGVVDERHAREVLLPEAHQNRRRRCHRRKEVSRRICGGFCLLGDGAVTIVRLDVLHLVENLSFRLEKY